jgi:hypothetical protein
MSCKTIDCPRDCGKRFIVHAHIHCDRTVLGICYGMGENPSRSIGMLDSSTLHSSSFLLTLSLRSETRMCGDMELMGSSASPVRTLVSPSPANVARSHRQRRFSLPSGTLPTLPANTLTDVALPAPTTYLIACSWTRAALSHITAHP